MEIICSEKSRSEKSNPRLPIKVPTDNRAAATKAIDNSVVRRYRQFFNDSDETATNPREEEHEGEIFIIGRVWHYPPPLPSAPSAQEPVRLGFLSSLSGTFGVLGAEQKRGLDLALEHLGNKLGGRPVTLIEADDKSNPVEAADLANKLVERDKVQVVTGLVASNSMLAAIDPLLKNNVFVVGANAGPAQLAGEKCNQNLFVVAFANEQWGTGLADYLNKSGVKRMMFLGMDYQAGWDHAKSVAKNFKGENLGEIYTPLTQMDFSSVLTQVRAAKPDAVYAFYVGGAAVPFMKQWKQSGLDKTVKLYSMGAIADSMLLPAIGDAALGLETAYSWNPEMKTPGNQRFVADFQKKYGRKPTQFAMFQYDAILLLDAALKEAGPENP